MRDVAVQWADEVLELVKTSKLDGVIVPPPVCDDHAVLDALHRGQLFSSFQRNRRDFDEAVQGTPLCSHVPIPSP